jgi:hypothetical protein
MMYTAPPQTSTTSNNTQYRHVHQFQETSAQKARQAAAAVSPGSTLLDVSNDSNGCPRKAHIRAADGHMKTVTFDDDQNVTHTQDGYN